MAFLKPWLFLVWLAFFCANNEKKTSNMGPRKSVAAFLNLIFNISNQFFLIENYLISRSREGLV